jgi:hypothetical protein
MRVVWLSFAPLRELNGRLTSDIASVRYRITLPAEAVDGSDVISLQPEAPWDALLARLDGTRAVVFGKIFDASTGQLALEVIAAVKQRGVRTLADFCDDHFDQPELGPFYHAMARAADVIVTSTPGLADVLRRLTSAPVHVVLDPVEGPRGDARGPRNRPVRLLWFGHPSNLDTLHLGLPQLRSHPFKLTLVTAAAKDRDERSGVRVRVWSLAALFDELRDCDAVIIPSDPQDPKKAVKSANRFTEALWAGRFVIAHRLPSYEPLGAFGWVGEDLGAGLAWLLDHPDRAAARIKSGQAWISEHLSPKAIAKAWSAAI